MNKPVSSQIDLFFFFALKFRQFRQNRHGRFKTKKPDSIQYCTCLKNKLVTALTSSKEPTFNPYCSCMKKKCPPLKRSDMGKIYQVFYRVVY